MPIVVGDIPVAPGDYVVADGTAVVFVGGRDVERVLAVAEDITSRERAMADSLLRGTSIKEVMGQGYETMLKR